MKITNNKIEEWFKNKYSDDIEYDGLKIIRTERRGGKSIEVKVISFGRKVGWFEGDESDRFFKEAENHFDWQFCIRRPDPI